MRRIRTDEVQVERTPTGYITTVKEIVRDGSNKRTEWVQVGYTSIEQYEEKGRLKERLTGPVGKDLLNG